MRLHLLRPAVVAALALVLVAGCIAPAGARPIRVDPDGAAELRVLGQAPYAHTGAHVAGAGDVNGDGLGDLVVSGDPATGAFVVFGGTTGDVDAEDLNGHGFAIETSSDEHLGHAVAGGGDVNGDGFDDVIVGAPSTFDGGNQAPGIAYVIFGSANPSDVDTGSLAGRGVRIIGEAFADAAGSAVAGAGDVDGDGLDDVIVGAPGSDLNGTHSGAAYVVYGKALGADVSLSALGMGGYRIAGPHGGRGAGYSVADAGDVNGDGTPDQILGAPHHLGAAPGAAYVVFGLAQPHPVDLENLGAGGWGVSGATHYDDAGVAVAGGEDVNGDGLDDIAIGAPDESRGRSYGGAAYVVFGKADTSPVDLAALGSAGIRLRGPHGHSGAGSALELVGDVDGNGRAELLVGAPGAVTSERLIGGVAYLITDLSVPGEIDLRSPKVGLKLQGSSEGDAFGTSVASTDLDGDGIEDLLVGAAGASKSRNARGITYGLSPDQSRATERPPVATFISYDHRQEGLQGSYCWHQCVDYIPRFPKAERAAPGDEANIRLGIRQRPTAFSISAYREVDEFGRPAGDAETVDYRYTRDRLGGVLAGQTITFDLPRGRGDLYLATGGRWGKKDSTWFFHLDLAGHRHTTIHNPPHASLRTGGAQQAGIPDSYCWSNEQSIGVTSTLCADYGNLDQSAVGSRPGAKAVIRLITRYAPAKAGVHVYRETTDSGYPTGPSRRVHSRVTPVRRDGRTVAHDVHFKLPRGPGDLYLVAILGWRGHGTVHENFHLRLR